MERNICIVATGVLLSVLTGAYAGTLVWTNTASGSFQTAANWNPNTVPGGLDTAQFSTSYAGTYTVTLDDHVSVTNVAWPSGVYGMTLDLNGRTLASASNGLVAVCSSATAGNAIDLTVKSSLPGGAFNLFQLDAFKGTVNSRGSISITGSNTTVNVTNGSTSDNGLLYLGSNTTFKVSEGAHLNVSQTILLGLGALPFGRNQVPTVSPKATMLLTDPGTTYSNVVKGLIIGKGGTNMPTLIVANGAICKSVGINVGSGGDTWYSYSPKANGKLVVTGTNSYCEASSLSSSALAGEFGTPGSMAGGSYVVENGGTLKSLGGISLSTGLIHYYPANNLNPGSETNLNAYGEMIVRNPGSSFKVTTDVQLTTVAKGALYVLDGASLISGVNSALYTSIGYIPVHITGTTTNQPAYTNDNAYGLFVVSNANSVATFRSVLFAHTAGYGDVVVADNARLSVTNGTGGNITFKNRSKLTVSDAFVETLTLTTASNSTIRIVLGARDHASAYIKATTAVTLNANGLLEVSVLDSATLNPGDTITLLTYTGSRTGTFKNLPEGSAFFADGRRFKIFYGDGSNDAITLKYVPQGTMIGVL